jgi:hypothetical protein
MSSIGKRFEIVFNEFFNNQQDYKHKVELLKSINKEFNSQNLNNLFSVISVTPIMLEVCKALNINLNYLAGIEDNKFIQKSNKFHYTEDELINCILYDKLELDDQPIIHVRNNNKISTFQTNSINLFFSYKKLYIVKSKGGFCGVVLINSHFEKNKLLVKFASNSDFTHIEKTNIEVLAEEI